MKKNFETNNFSTYPLKRRNDKVSKNTGMIPGGSLPRF